MPRGRGDDVAVYVERAMLGMMMLGITGGIIGAIVASPYGFAAAFVAYCLSGSLLFLVPGVLREPRRYEPSRVTVQGRSSL